MTHLPLNKYNFLSIVKDVILLVICGYSSLGLLDASIDPKNVVIIYNSNNKASKELATYYSEQRSIPASNIVGLSTSSDGHITRDEYISTIQNPLRKQFEKNGWWKLGSSKDDIILPVVNKKRLLVCMYGIPYAIKQTVNADEANKKKPAPQKINSAAVDSELTLFGIQGIPIQGPLINKYFKENSPFSSLKKLTPYFLVGRIDGPDFATSKRLIDDAIATEESGLWGMSYLDLAVKGKNYKIGDDWIEQIEKLNWQHGIPTTIDKNKRTYVMNYPMRDVSQYYGWYSSKFNGPLLNPNFRFKRGAIAMHIHSFSANDLRNKNVRWVGPILSKGAAATVGNVYEPYLNTTHHFDTLQSRLIDGYSFIEAATMSIPVLSWQSLAIADPLYQPYKRIDGSGFVATNDKIYRSVNLAFKAWKNSPEKLIEKLKRGALLMKDSRFHEIIGLWYKSLGEYDKAIETFAATIDRYPEANDKIRIALHLADLYLIKGSRSEALDILQRTYDSYSNVLSAQSLKSLLIILNPPEPPPASADKSRQ